MRALTSCNGSLLGGRWHRDTYYFCSTSGGRDAVSFVRTWNMGEWTGKGSMRMNPWARNGRKWESNWGEERQVEHLRWREGHVQRLRKASTFLRDSQKARVTGMEVEGASWCQVSLRGDCEKPFIPCWGVFWFILKQREIAVVSMGTCSALHTGKMVHLVVCEKNRDE